MLVLKKLLASVYQVFIFGPQGFFSSSIVSMTAGRDSRSLTTAFLKHCALVKCPLHLIPFYSLAVSVKIRQSREELTRQPEQHHRVVILQPPPSLDGGLDSQSLFLRVWFFNCPTKAMLLYLCNGDSSRALFPKHIRRVSYPSRKYTTGCYMHRFLPLQQFLEENYVCCLLLFYFYNQELHFLHYSEYGTGFVFDGCCSKRGIYEAQTVPPLQNLIHSALLPTKTWKSCDWWIFIFGCALVFLVSFRMLQSQIRTCEQSNGRQKPLNYHCEGLLV